MPTIAGDSIDTLAAMEALRKLKSTDPPLYLSPSEDLSKGARLASEYLFSLLKPYTPKSPFSQLLVNGFDAEQIWQQIDLQSQPLVSSLRQRVKKYEKNPQEIGNLFNLGEESKRDDDNIDIGDAKRAEEDEEGFDGLEDEEMKAFHDVDDKDDEEEEGEGEGDEGLEEDGGGGGGVEDKFLKIKELEEYLEEDEAREYGMKRKKMNKGKGNEEEGDEEDKGEDDDEEEDELGVMGIDDGEGDESAEELENAR